MSRQRPNATPNTTAKIGPNGDRVIAGNTIGGDRNKEDLAVNSVARARKSNARNGPRKLIEDLQVAMIAGPARADRNDTRIIVRNRIVSPSQTNRSLRLP